MTGTIILKSPFVVLKYHPVERIVHHEFLQHVTSEVLRGALTTGLALMNQNRANKWLSDERNNAELSEGDDHWVQTTWFPEAMKSTRYWAIIVREKGAAQPHMNRYVKTTKSGPLTTAMFSEPKEAFEWLRSVT